MTAIEVALRFIDDRLALGKPLYFDDVVPQYFRAIFGPQYFDHGYLLDQTVRDYYKLELDCNNRVIIRAK